MIDPTKTHTTRSGKPVKIYEVEDTVAGLVFGSVKTDCGWDLCRWTKAGAFCSSVGLICADLALVEAPVRHQLKRWVNVYRDDDGTVRTDGSLYSCRDGADSQADADLHHGRLAGTERIACLPITLDFCEGEGL